MTTPTELRGPAGADSRAPDLVLAGVHLRLGSLGLARAELETLAGRDLLDDAGVRDLTEVRWRTGDLAGAGEGAAAYLEEHPTDVLCLVIAAESQASLGRPGEARRLAGKALEAAGGPLDPIFAGMPRSQIWPIDPGMTEEPGTLFDDLHPGPAELPRSTAAAVAPVDPALPERLHPHGPGLWGDDIAGEDAPIEPLSAGSLFERAHAALDRGQTADAAAGLTLALRAEPSLAPGVLQLLAGRSEAALVLVRGDAQRIVGHEAEALRDHAAVVAALDADRFAEVEAEAEADAAEAEAAADAADDPAPFVVDEAGPPPPDEDDPDRPAGSGPEPA